MFDTIKSSFENLVFERNHQELALYIKNIFALIEEPVWLDQFITQEIKISNNVTKLVHSIENMSDDQKDADEILRLSPEHGLMIMGITKSDKLYNLKINRYGDRIIIKIYDQRGKLIKEKSCLINKKRFKK